MPYLPLPDHRLHYRIDGETGPWLVFCNSLATDLTMWDAQVAALSDSFRILRYDRRGHGGSSAPAGPCSLADLGGDVIALLDHLGISRAHFCGLSIGGMVGQWLALNAPERIERLVLCATAARIGTAESWNERATAVLDRGLDWLTEATAERWFTPAFHTAHPDAVRAILDRFAATSPQGYAACCAALAAADFRDRLGQIGHPVLAIAGADDPVCPPGDLERIASAVPEGKLCVLPARHILNVESETAFVGEIKEFLCRASVG